MPKFRSKIIRLAHEVPGLRAHLLPLLKEGAYGPTALLPRDLKKGELYRITRPGAYLKGRSTRQVTKLKEGDILRFGGWSGTAYEGMYDNWVVMGGPGAGDFYPDAGSGDRAGVIGAPDGRWLERVDESEVSVSPKACKPFKMPRWQKTTTTWNPAPGRRVTAWVREFLGWKFKVYETPEGWQGTSEWSSPTSFGRRWTWPTKGFLPTRAAVEKLMRPQMRELVKRENMQIRKRCQ
jgi:hypothetical protein